MRMLKLRGDQVGGVDQEVHTTNGGTLEHLTPLKEKHWTILKKHLGLDPCLLNMHALELDMCHLEIEHSVTT